MHDAAGFAEFKAVFDDTLQRLAAHLETSAAGTTPATGYAPLAEVLDALDAERWIAAGGMRRDDFERFLERFLRYSVQLRSPRYMAHQVSLPDYPAGLAALINGLTNNPMAIYEMGPAAAALEFAVVNWMLRKVGWTPQPLYPGAAKHAAGVLTHGGSVANLTALLAARGTLCPGAWRDGVDGGLVLLAPPSSHYSVQRAAGILGLGTRAVVALPADEWGVVRAADIAATVDRVRDAGMRCMAIVANACATATGLHDPLRAMGEYCRSEHIWFHVDACHGATALLGRQSRRYLDGIELADSVVWDTHKMMQVPTLCAAVLFRDSGSFDAAFRQEASYLAYGADRDAYDSLPRALECTKAALGFKIFMNLAWRGERALGDYVDERYAITRRFREIALSRPGFDAPYEPESNILCLRFGDDDALQETIRRGLMVDGEFHLSSALVGGRRYLRITVMNALTDERVFAALLDAIERRAAQETG